MRRLEPLLLLGLLLVPSAVATDWPMGGRSSDRNPVSPEKNAPTDWHTGDETTKPRNIKWSVKVEGGSRAIGGPVVSGGLIWVGSTDANYDDEDDKRDNAVLACYR